MRRQKKVLRRARHPLRRSKYANHMYNDRQYVILLVLRQRFRMPCRQFCETIEVCTALGGFLLVAGKMMEAEVYASRAVKEARDIGALNVLVSSLYNLAILYQEKGSGSMAVPLLEEAMNLYERLDKYD